MATSEDLIDRRHFIGTTVALAATFALPARGLAQMPAQVRLGDAHVHLFNLADLPARGFFEHAVLWNTQLDFWLMRPLWPAMLDMIAFFKAKSITAAEELAAYSYDPEAREDIGKLEFQDIANRRVSNLARQSRVYQGAYRVTPPESLSAAQQHLRDSYYQLGAWLAIAGQPIWRRKRGEGVEVATLADVDIARIRGGARRLHERSCPEAPRESGNMTIGETIRYTLEWGRALMQSRQFHLRLYRERIGEGKLRPTTMVNLLVDYDEWLGDGPRAGSDTATQIAFWHRLREDYRREQGLDIRTFAGFDPLKDALEHVDRLRSGAPTAATTFERNCVHFREGKVHGFKLYPPMGFRPIGNEASMFRSRRRGMGVVRDRLAAGNIEWSELPRLLDGALQRFYGFCSEEGAPILAHAYHSNEASLCAAARAGPSGWTEVVDQHRRLRICLGHFAEGVGFARAMERHLARRPVHRRNWPFHGTQDLLRQNGPERSEVFLDLGYMAEFLHDGKGRERAIAFFQALGDYCRRYDEGCEHFMFGTDWIMLEREARSEKYVTRIREGMAVAGWPESWQRNLLHDNLQKFLQPRAAAVQQPSAAF